MDINKGPKLNPKPQPENTEDEVQLKADLNSSITKIVNKYLKSQNLVMKIDEKTYQYVIRDIHRDIQLFAKPKN